MDDLPYFYDVSSSDLDADLQPRGATSAASPSTPARDAAAPAPAGRRRRPADGAARCRADPGRDGRRVDAHPRSEEQFDAVDLYFDRVGQRPLLTREGEVELARRIEEREHELLEALLQAPAALRELGALGAELGAGRLRLRDVLRDVNEERLADEADTQRLVTALKRAGARALAMKRGAARAGEGRALLAELSYARFHRRAFDRVVEAARAAPGGDEAGRAIEAKRRAVDRAKAELVESNLRLVVLFARRHLNQGLQLLDLIQEGNIGLMRAVDKFDHRRGIRFSTYAAWWVRQQMTRAIAEQGKTIRVPVHMVESRQKLMRARRRFVHEHGREPDELELVAATGILSEKVRAVGRLAPEPLSLQAPAGAEGEATVADFVPDRATLAPDEQVARTRIQAQARALVGTLSPREQEVLRLRFGLEGSEEHTLQEIGARLSVSRERVRQIEAEALRKLRGPSLRDDLEAYFDAA